jgi:hypothetical protein
MNGLEPWTIRTTPGPPGPSLASAPGKVLRLILLASFFPLALYLLVLGGINRRRFPLLVSGVWDFIGLLFGVSGFLLLAGPALLSSLNERWRLALSLLYFVLVAAGAAYLLWQQRPLTSVFNADRALIEKCLDRICAQLQIAPVRSGNLYLFGLAVEAAARARVPAHEGIQAPHYLPQALTKSREPGQKQDGMRRESGEHEFLDQTAILEVETFPALRHATLRWEPVDSLFRREIEARLERALAEAPPAPEGEVGTWLMVLGLCMLAGLFLGEVAILAVRVLWRS